MPPFILMLTYVAGIIVLFDCIIKTRTMLHMKKNKLWCPKNRWFYTSEWNEALSHSWYKTIEIAESIRVNRLQLKEQ
jgi:hypothetical protein